LRRFQTRNVTVRPVAQGRVSYPTITTGAPAADADVVFLLTPNRADLLGTRNAMTRALLGAGRTGRPSRPQVQAGVDKLA
jgi:hypothetical protein